MATIIILFFFLFFYLFYYYGITTALRLKDTLHTHTHTHTSSHVRLRLLASTTNATFFGNSDKKDPLSIDTYAPQPWQASPTARMALPPSRLLPPTSGISTASNPNFAKVSWTCVRLYRSALLASISVTTPHDFK